ncbi:3-methylaspartate ammonia-lyase [Compostibacillus humi]|uniref:3-methylaspartate ammonia-lyase n=1 Tax=Compostibacillus humi TaxID=1245525 RepID=A0A8J2TQH3_9BACI|nr:acyclic terpene utilization AtuA family protein [Compostibacillus humi]GFZ86753.1 3-methylaspartate ammonia-lyase [Compostibacillus humi]HLT55042.1 acyclic terpene utilization AtuA family protein [Bacillota bacterium]
MKKELRIVSPNGHLGFAPTKEESFYLAKATKPDYYCCDSGSDDIGPTALGSDRSVSMYRWQKHDLELMLLAAREQGVPMLIGSAGDTGANSRVDMYVQMIKDIAKEHRLPPFKIGYFYSEVDKDYLYRKLDENVPIEGLDNRPNLTKSDLEKTDRIVAVAGIHPFMKALDLGADVIIGGRSSDCAIFAAPAIREGFPEANAYYLGKVLECASFCAEPYGAKESVIGTITHEDVKVTAMHPEQRCTVASVAGHAMYERANPYYEYFAGGMLDMKDCTYEQYDEKTCRITGAKYYPAEQIKVKLEGSGKVGEKFIGIAGVRDPYTLQHIDDVIHFARAQTEKEFQGKEYHLHFHMFGKNGVMREMEPVKNITPHELGIVVEGIAKDKTLAEELTLFATRQIFYARLPEVKGTAGTAAYLIDDVIYAGPSYEWTMNHTVPVKDPLELFDVHIEEVN